MYEHDFMLLILKFKWILYTISAFFFSLKDEKWPYGDKFIYIHLNYLFCKS